MSCFEILGIEPTSDVHAIKKAYAKMAAQYHPEEDEKVFLRIHNAYQQAIAYAKQLKDQTTRLDALEQPKDKHVKKTEDVFHLPALEVKKDLQTEKDTWAELEHLKERQEKLGTETDTEAEAERIVEKSRDFEALKEETQMEEKEDAQQQAESLNADEIKQILQSEANEEQAIKPEERADLQEGEKARYGKIYQEYEALFQEEQIALENKSAKTCMNRINALYQNGTRHGSAEEWKKIFSSHDFEQAAKGSDFALEVVNYFMLHREVPKSVWQSVFIPMFTDWQYVYQNPMQTEVVNRLQQIVKSSNESAKEKKGSIRKVLAILLVVIAAISRIARISNRVEKVINPAPEYHLSDTMISTPSIDYTDGLELSDDVIKSMLVHLVEQDYQMSAQSEEIMGFQMNKVQFDGLKQVYQAEGTDALKLAIDELIQEESENTLLEDEG